MRTSLTPPAFLASILTQLQLTATPELSAKLLAYLDLLARWNRTYNLTAISDPYDRIVKHIADSLVVVPYIGDSGAYWLDVGSGAGLPGIPLALVFPDKQWTLLDCNAKKTRFLLQVKAVLGLSNVTILHSHVELLKAAEQFDGIICRAWTNLHDMIGKTCHLYKENAYLWAMKGVHPQAELAAITQPYEVYSLQVPQLAEQRHLIRINVYADREIG